MIPVRLSGLLILTILLAGCRKSGPELAPVSGRVTLDGRPVASADVVFQPDGAMSPSYGRTDGDGQYQLGYKRGVEGAMVGQHTVRISVSRELVRNPPPIPPRYNTESELRREVEPSKKNVFDFELSTQAK
jgi:hypothetical protein